MEERKPRTFIIHHSIDNDGWFSAWMVRKYLERHEPEHAEEIIYIPFNYEDDRHIYHNTRIREIMSWDYVYIVDATLSTWLMTALYGMLDDPVMQLIWIDHHKTAIDRSIKDEFDSYSGHRSVEHSAARLTHWYFNWLIYWTKDWYMGTYEEYRDSVDNRVSSYNKAIQAVNDWDTHSPDQVEKEHFWFGLGSRECSTFPWESHETCLWSRLHDDPSGEECKVYYETVELGKERDAKEQILFAEFRDKLMFETEFKGLKLLAMQKLKYGSRIFGEVDWTKYHAVATFDYYEDRDMWTYRLYTGRQDQTLGDIAAILGGGGHAGAAGWTTAKGVPLLKEFIKPE